MINHEQRGTGRTTRMLESAIAAAKAGKYVCVFCGSVAHARAARDSAWEILKRTGDHFKSYSDTPPCLKVGKGIMKFECSESCSGWNWQEMRPVGCHTQVPIFIDHFPVERKIAELEAEIARLQPFAHRWDLSDDRLARLHGMNDQFRNEYLCSWPPVEPLSPKLSVSQREKITGRKS